MNSFKKKRQNPLSRISYQSGKVSPASQKHVKHTNSGRRRRSVSSADRSWAAYRLADSEFHPSSFGHSSPIWSHLWIPDVCVQPHPPQPASIWKFSQFLNYSLAEGILCQQLPKQLHQVDHNRWIRTEFSIVVNEVNLETLHSKHLVVQREQGC